MNEPRNGTPIVRQRHGSMTVWIRDDTTAKGLSDPLSRWFDADDYCERFRWGQLLAGANIYVMDLVWRSRE